jgi:hypothetical protein
LTVRGRAVAWFAPERGACIARRTDCRLVAPQAGQCAANGGLRGAAEQGRMRLLEFAVQLRGPGLCLLAGAEILLVIGDGNAGLPGVAVAIDAGHVTPPSGKWRGRQDAG